MFLSLGRYLCWWTINPRGYHPPSIHCFYHWDDTSAGGLLIPEGIIRQVFIVSSLGRYLCWWTINPRGYHPPCSHCFYHWVDTSAGGLLIPEGIIRQVFIVSITAVDTSAGGILIPEGIIRQVFIVSSLGRYRSWWTINPRGYHPPSIHCFYHCGRYLCWWTINHRGYHPPSSHCFYHWDDTSAGGLLIPEGIICQVVIVSITGAIPLLVDY